MPCRAENFLLFSLKIASSGSTNLDGRSTRKLAPFSTSNFGAGTSATGMAGARAAYQPGRKQPGAEPDGPAACPIHHDVAPPLYWFLASGKQALARLPVKQMSQMRLCPDADRLTGRGRNPLAECAQHRQAPHMADHLRLGAGGLEHLDLEGEPTG